MHYWSTLLLHNFAMMAGLDAEVTKSEQKTDPAFLSADGWMDPIYDPSCLQVSSKENLPLSWSKADGLLNRRNGVLYLVPEHAAEPLPLREDACFEQDFSLGEPVIVLSRHEEDRITRQLVISQELYTAALPFRDFEESFIPAIEEFLEMPTGHQAVVLAFLNNPFFAGDYFPALCCIASHVQENNGCLPEGEALDRIIEEFNTFCVPKRNTDTVNVSDCLLLLEASRIPHLGTSDIWYTFLALWALMNGCSVWSRDPGGPALALVRSDMKYAPELSNCLNRICTRAMTEGLTLDLLHIAATHPLSRRHAEFLLKALLCRSKTLPEQLIPPITRRLFHCGNDLSKFQYLHIVLEGPNADPFLRYVSQEFHSAAATGNTDYTYAMAAIRRSLRSDGQSLPPVQDPQEEDILTLAELTLNAQDHIRSTCLSPMELTLTEQDPVLQQLLVWLRDPESPCYTLACDAAESLYLVFTLDNRYLEQEDILLAAAQALLLDPGSPARKLLATLSLNTRLPDFPGKHVLQETLLWQFTQNLEASRMENIVPLFRSCVAAGCWKRTQLAAHYCDVTAALAALPEPLQGLQAARFQMLKQELHFLIRKDTAGKTDPDLLEKTLFSHMPPDTAPVLALLEKLKKQSSLLQLITDQALALSILHYIHSEACDAETELLLDRCILEVPDAGSLLVSQWYYLLCIFGRIKAALYFRNRHKDLLERPWFFRGNPLNPLPRYADFLQRTSRGQLGLELALLLTGVDPKNSFHYNQQLHDLSHTVLRARKGRLGETYAENLHIARTEAMSIFVTEDPEGLWRLYYDDPGLTGPVLKHCPDSHQQIFSLSYGTDPEMALTAVRVRGESLIHLSGWLKKNDTICTEALRQSSLVLNLIHAPMARDHDLIRSLLEGQPLRLSMAPKWLCEDRAFILAHLKHRPQDFSFVDPELQKDKEVVLTALAASDNKTAILHRIDPALRLDEDILRLCEEE